MLRPLSTVALALTMATSAFGQGSQYKPLAENRAVIQFPGYTPEQKELVAKNAQVILSELYVNRERKIEFYGPAVDPVPAVAQVVADARFLSELELHGRLEKIFQGQHDHHLSYNFPAPYACYRTALPFSVAQAYAPNGQLVIAVSAITPIPEMLAVSSEFQKIAVGDQLLSFDGMPALDAALALQDLAGGSNEAGRLRSALGMLTFRSQRRHVLPDHDLVRLVFKNRLGEDYAAEAPWVSYANQACLNSQQGGGFARAAKYDGTDEDQIERELLYKPHRRSSEAEAITDTEEPTLHWDVINNEYGRFAYLRLDSFVPEVLSIPATVQLIKKLLENELAHTDGLIFDLRDNGGGMITYGESLVQLFTPKNIKAQRFRLKNSEANRQIFELAPSFDPEFGVALGVARTIGAKYTAALPFATPELLNDTAQAYFKPVAVLTNSSCYSTCDMTSASLQDHGVATIWGEDRFTGAGGANNMQLSSFLQLFPTDRPAPLQALPGGQGMGFAWRQMVRVGLHAGQLLEETGVEADRLAVPKLADFFNQSAEQIRLISADLNQKAISQKSWFKFVTPGKLDLKVGQPVEFGMRASATAAVELRAKGETLGYQVLQAPASAEGTPVQVVVPGTPAVGTVASTEVIGYLAGERVWRAVKTYRVVPEATPFAEGQTIALSFDSPDVTPLVIFTEGAEASQGWTVVDGKLKTGTGDAYVDDVTTTASLFIDLTARQTPATLSFDLQGQTEKDFDFFGVSAVVDGQKSVLFGDVSGTIAAQRVALDLAPFAGKVVELKITFASDSGVTDQGVTIDNVEVK